MNNTVIDIENLGKKYIIKHEGKSEERYQTFRDSMLRGIKRLYTDEGKKSREQKEDFWAIRNIYLKISKGDKLGIIGKNGAGKSTLLKILNRVTEPTEGIIRIKGRIAGLLEVGTGFHPELTGRENIFLNGTILGMKRWEIRKKFDEIVEFSEIEQFLDTPVKRYSSGMYMRLAFAVAAHLEHEILVVDEVLAVGDAEFQKKCLGKIEDINRSEGRTVLFVSHNMATIRNLCERAILLNRGRIVEYGFVNDVIERYLAAYQANADIAEQLKALPSDPVFRFIRVRFIQKGKELMDVLSNDIPLEVVVEYEVYKTTVGLRVFIDLLNSEGILVIRTFHDEHSSKVPVLNVGTYASRATIPGLLLAPGKYTLEISAAIHNVRRIFPSSLSVTLEVESGSGIGSAYPDDPVRSIVQPFIQWETCGAASQR